MAEKLQIFNMKADCYFYAHNINDAFNYLAWHFLNCRYNDGQSPVIRSGQLSVHPCQVIPANGNAPIDGPPPTP